ncbi:MAG: DUF58 domain-containing protein [Oscillospiraceae bacterium]|nr:DUF58 domain-containing protein [Oscillospiraceae bacterium]
MRRNRIGYSLLILFCIFLVWLFGNKLSYTLLYTVLLFPALSLGLTAFLSRRLAVTQSIPAGQAVKGDIIECSIHLQNRWPIPCGYLKLTYAPDAALLCENLPVSELTLLPMTDILGRLHFRCRHSGVFEIGIEQVILTDFLGLFTFISGHRQQLLLTVYPRVFELPGMPPALVSMDVQARQARVEDDYSTIVDFRQYQPTDHMKLVHWKLSAKRGEWVIKNFGSTADLSTAILLDTQPPPFAPERYIRVELEDRMREGAVSLLNYCSSREEPADFVYAARTLRIMPLTEIGFSGLYPICASLPFSSELSAAAALDEFLNQRQEAASYWILAAHLDEDLFESLAVLYQSGRSLTLVLFQCAEPAAEAVHAADAARLAKATAKSRAWHGLSNKPEEIELTPEQERLKLFTAQKNRIKKLRDMGIPVSEIYPRKDIRSAFADQLKIDN